MWQSCREYPLSTDMCVWTPIFIRESSYSSSAISCIPHHGIHDQPWKGGSKIHMLSLFNVCPIKGWKTRMYVQWQIASLRMTLGGMKEAGNYIFIGECSTLWGECEWASVTVGVALGVLFRFKWVRIYKHLWHSCSLCGILASWTPTTMHSDSID